MTIVFLVWVSVVAPMLRPLVVASFSVPGVACLCPPFAFCSGSSSEAFLAVCV